jgi:ATPase subunit of ABC transporter with duplicated ATPase domains
LLKLITGELQPDSGSVFLGVSSVAFLDQNVSLLDNTKTILENILSFANNSLSESELRIRLARLLFFNDDVYKNVGVLSGGERMRLGLACLFAKAEPPGLILLDEPTNNLDLKSIQQMTKMLNEYGGPLIVVSHDRDFINDLHVNHELMLARAE